MSPPIIGETPGRAVYRKLAVAMPDGSEVAAPIEEWIAAMIVMLPAEVRRQLVERVSRKIVGYSTPGSHILRAEGLELMFDGKK